MHQQIVLSYKKLYQGQWQLIDEYGKFHLLQHLLAINAKERVQNTPRVDTEMTEYATRYLFHHLIEAERANEIEIIIAKFLPS